MTRTYLNPAELLLFRSSWLEDIVSQSYFKDMLSEILLLTILMENIIRLHVQIEQPKEILEIT